jgi:uncharacterized membrane protein HdeD (DUF308 family)
VVGLEVDTSGLLPAVVVTVAGLQDRDDATGGCARTTETGDSAGRGEPHGGVSSDGRPQACRVADKRRDTMQADTSEFPRPVRGLLRREAAKWWWGPLVAGIVWFVIAWLVLRLNVTSLATVGVLVGVVLLIAAASEGALAGIVSGGWKAMHVVLAVLFVLGAVWSFVRPINTVFALASVLGLLLFLQGALYIAQGAELRDVSPYWWVELGCGVLLVLLALWVSTSDRAWTLAARAVFILLWVGFMAVFRGISDIVLAFELRRLGHEAEDRQREPAPAAAGAPPDIPAQGRRSSAEVQPGQRG